MTSGMQCFALGRTQVSQEQKSPFTCFSMWTQRKPMKEDLFDEEAKRIAEAWNVSENAAQAWLQGDSKTQDAVEEQFRRQTLKQANSYDSNVSSESETSNSSSHSDNESSGQNSALNTHMDTADLSATSQNEWERRHFEDAISTTLNMEVQQGRIKAGDNLLQKDVYINPHDIFFCSRSNGKLLRLGKGSFGSVYKGVWNMEMVAVKVCSQYDTTERSTQQFLQEVCILERCRHPNVVQFKGACSWKGGKRTVLVTEFMEKGDLASALWRAASKYSWHRLGKQIALDIAKGLAALHAHNIVHFDLKSGNILLDKYNTAKIADVGLARILTRSHGSANLSTFLQTADLGTFSWAAPEALLGNSCDCSADVFSYGIVLWELCTAETPQDRNLRPIRVPEEAPQAVADLVKLCLQFEPSARPSAQEIIVMLEQLLSDENLIITSTSVIYETNDQNSLSSC